MPTNLFGTNDNFDFYSSHVLPAFIRKFHLGKCLLENNWEGIYNDLKKSYQYKEVINKFKSL